MKFCITYPAVSAVHIGHRSGYAGLPLIFAVIRSFGRLPRARKYDLSKPHPGFEYNRRIVCVVQFESELTFESRSDPPGVLYKQPEASIRTPSLDESRKVVRYTEILTGRNEYEFSRVEKIAVSGNCFVFGDPSREDRLVSSCYNLAEYVSKRKKSLPK